MKKVFLEKGVKNCLIVIPDDASVVEKTAAEELSEYIEKSLAVKLPIVSESAASGKCIFVGQTETAKKAGVLGKSKENWIPFHSLFLCWKKYDTGRTVRIG